MNHQIVILTQEKVNSIHNGEITAHFLVRGFTLCRPSRRSYPPRKARSSFWPAQQLAGYSLGELAQLAGIPIPRDLKRDKGWIGILLEIWLGASAGSKPEQDFAALGVELKTIPIDSSGRPLETTFVCVAPLTGNSASPGEQPRAS